jgi:Zn-dependent peptidase ImmA (M78 family)
MNARDAILTGVGEAKRLHKALNLEGPSEQAKGYVDVFEATRRLGVTMLFRPLNGLLGFCLPPPTRGIVISTNRPLSVQRFTGAHELGHAVMEHAASLDGDEILDGKHLTETQEIEANAFASEFLLPRWLLAHHGRRQGWDKESLADPLVVYQLSLRLGVSYQATCVSLKLHKLIDSSLFAKLDAVPRKQIKQQLLKGVQLDHWRRDVWLLTKRDEGSFLQGQPEDVFLFRLNEKSGAGYLWDIHELQQKGFAIVRDHRDLGTGDAIGDTVQREVAAQSQLAAEGDVLLEQRRPWQKLGLPCERLELHYDLQGKEQGFSRSMRKTLQAA